MDQATSSISPLTSIHSAPASGNERATIRYASPSLPDLIVDRDSAAGHRVVYMGDSSNMKYLVSEVGDPFKHFGRSRLWGDHLQQSLLNRLTPATQSKLAALRSNTDQYLRDLGAHDLPDTSLGEELIDVFFDRAYAFLPIFDKADFMSTYKVGKASLLVMNALYCVSAIHCSEELLQRLGYESRYLACSTFYHRAKALYENDYERDGISNVQACILLMNWWQGPMEQKDTWYWLGVASNLAQALGMHRAYGIFEHTVDVSLTRTVANHTRSCPTSDKSCGEEFGGLYSTTISTTQQSSADHLTYIHSTVMSSR